MTTLNRKQEKSPSLSTNSYNHKQELKKKSTEVDTLLVANPSSASGSTGKDWENLYVTIKEALGENSQVLFTKKAGDGTRLTREFLKKVFGKVVVAMGGDGTINEVANGFFFTDKNNDPRADSKGSNGKFKIEIPKPSILKSVNPEAIMGLIPSGTGNVLARFLGLPQGLMECCDNFVNGKIQKLDVITATVTDLSNRSKVSTRAFLNAAEIGFGAEVIDRSKKVRNKA